MDRWMPNFVYDYDATISCLGGQFPHALTATSLRSSHQSREVLPHSLVRRETRLSMLAEEARPCLPPDTQYVDAHTNAWIPVIALPSIKPVRHKNISTPFPHTQEATRRTYYGYHSAPHKSA